ncbi:MAG: ABC transporter permease subunit, partial [Tumebacillaceae bacterium]
MKSATSARFLYSLSWVLFLALVFANLFGSYLMPHRLDLNERLPYTFQAINGQNVMVSAPYAPSAAFWLGSDHRGYDMLSLLLNGAKYTFFFAFGVTFFRFLIALPLGILSGVKGKGMKAIASVSVVFSSVPALLFVFPVMYGLAIALRINNGMPITDPRNQLFAAFLFVFLVVLGLFQVANQLVERTRFYRFKQYVEASTVIGASSWRIAFKHILPHLRSEILFAFLADLVAVLSVIGQLGVFGVFIGGGEIVQITPSESMTLTNVGEWGSLIAYGVKNIRAYPWIIISVAAFFTFTVFALTFFSKQLQKRMNRPAIYVTKPVMRNGRVLSFGGLVACAFLLTPLLLTSKSPTATLSSSDTMQMITPKV